jgi:hypothetical protein
MSGAGPVGGVPPPMTVAKAEAAIDEAVARVNAPAGGVLLNIGETLATLRDGIAFVDGQLRHELGGGREALLDQVRALHSMEDELGSLKAGAQHLVAMVGQVNRDMGAPHRTMQRSVTQLRHMHEASELLRGVQHFLWLCKKLTGYMESSSPSTGSSEVDVSELEGLRAVHQKQFARLPLVYQELRRAEGLAAKLRALCQSRLFRAVAHRKQTQTAHALQAFLNLGGGAGDASALARAIDGCDHLSTCLRACSRTS